MNGINGPGKYDDLATDVRSRAAAIGVAVMVFGGQYGDGFSVQVPAHILITLPEVLRGMANEIDKQLAGES